MRRLFQLADAQTGVVDMRKAWEYAKAALIAGHPMTVEVRKRKRSDGQNRLMWALLHDLAAQVDWYGRRLTAEEWKHVLTASLSKQDVVPGIDGGFVVLGKSTSDMTTAEMNDLITLIEAFGAEQGVRFSAPEHEEYR